MVSVKICGITNLEDACAALDAGCDCLGFVFYKKSPRYISPLKAKRIISRLPKATLKAGVFVNSREKKIKEIARFLGLDLLQFHGAESPEFCCRFQGYKIIKAFRIKDRVDFKVVSRYKVFAYLFDAFVKSKPGGTGKNFNWKLLQGIRKLNLPIFLSGGLNNKNIAKAIAMVRPDWIDASSSLELRPGRKDEGKIRDFVQKAKR